MSLTRRIAQPALGAIFLTSGVNTLRQPDYIVAQTRAAGLSEPELLTKIHAATNLAGGLALTTNRFPRLASLGLALGLVPTTVVGHPFWSAGPEDKQMQQINFLKNLSMFGGLLIAAADTGGRESLPHRVGRLSSRKARKAEAVANKATRKASKKADRKARKKTAQAAKKAVQRAGTAPKAPVAATRSAGGSAARTAAKTASRTAKTADSTAKTATRTAGRTARTATKSASKVSSTAGKKAAKARGRRSRLSIG